MEEKEKKVAAIKQLIPLKRLIIAGALLTAGVLGLVAARCISGFADLYGFNIYPVIVSIFANISGIFPFSVGEIMLILAVLAVLFAIVYFIVNMIRRRGKRVALLLSSAATVLLAASIVVFDFAYAMGINYSRKPFSVIAGLQTSKYTKEEVREVLLWSIENLTAAGEKVTPGEDGHVTVPEDMPERAIAAMKKLGERYESLNSTYTRIKPVMMSELMCYGHITGIFSFFSMEANYNTMNVPEEIGHTVCHELSHMTGFMREDEANFIAFLACRDSGDPYLEYSGWYDIMIYLLNAYATSSTDDEYYSAFAAIPRYALEQMDMQSRFWKKYETHFGEVAEAMNDTYLKMNDQPEGTKSYGRVVDLAIADYFANKNGNDKN